MHLHIDVKACTWSQDGARITLVCTKHLANNRGRHLNNYYDPNHNCGSHRTGFLLFLLDFPKTSYTGYIARSIPSSLPYYLPLSILICSRCFPCTCTHTHTHLYRVRVKGNTLYIAIKPTVNYSAIESYIPQN